MEEKKNNVLRLVPIGKEEPERVRVDPEKDPVVKLTFDILKLMLDRLAAEPTTVLASMLLAGDVLSDLVLGAYSREDAVSIINVSKVLSRKYRVELKHGEPEAEPVVGDPADDA